LKVPDLVQERKETMRKGKIQKEETVTGVVSATEWDDEDNVIAVSIITDDDEYMIDSNKMAEELFDFLEEDVEVTGIVETDRDGSKRISVTSYEVLDTGYEYDDEEDYGYDYDQEEYDEDYDDDDDDDGDDR